MKQLEVPDDIKIDIDLTDNHVPASVKTFQPVLFKEADEYCCVLGPDLENGVVGRGKTPRDAFKDWDKKLQRRKKVEDRDDEVAVYIHRVLNPDGDLI